MIFSKQLFKCKFQQTDQKMLHTIDYYKAFTKIENVRYKIIQSMMQGRDIIIEVDTTLLSSNIRLDPAAYVAVLQDKLTQYGIQYKISRAKKEVPDVGLARMFSMKSTKMSTAYTIYLYIPSEKFTEDMYKDLLTGMGHRICILNHDSDVEALLELFYSGMIEESDPVDVFYAHFYCNEQLHQILVETKSIQKDEMKALLEEIV